jgi:serine/threonine protein kinase
MVENEKSKQLGNSSLQSLQYNPKIENVIKEIKDICQFWNITLGSENVIYKESGSCKYEIIFKLADFLDDFVFVGRVVFYLRNRPYKLSFDTFLVNLDYTPVCVKNPNTRFLIRRHLLKLNSLLKFGSFSIDESGVIKFHLVWNYETNAHLAMRTREDLEKWMKISLATTMSTLKVNMTKLLIMTELIEMPKYDNVVASQTNSIRQLPKFFYEDQKTLKGLILDGVKLKTGNKDEVKKEIKPDKLPDYPYPFYQTVKVVYIDYHGRLTLGGYASIHVVKAKMIVTEEIGGERKQVEKDKYFLAKVPRQPANVKKQDKEYVLEIAEGKYTESDPRINIERRVISHPKDKNFQHIARYYDDILEKDKDGKEPPQRPLLYMENYMPQNLHEFNAKKDLSMSTKLSWLYQLSHVLMYLEKNNIVHVDLKPSNIVVAKNFFLKVIDFAESIIKGVKDFKNDRRATTMPFSSPETLDENTENVGYESDVFSYAHIAYELLGGKLMIGFKRSSENKVRQRYRKKTFKLLPIKSWLNFQGPTYLMQYIYHIIMLCTTPDPTCRFPQVMLVNFIKEYALFTEKLF